MAPAKAQLVAWHELCSESALSKYPFQKKMVKQNNKTVTELISSNSSLSRSHVVAGIAHAQVSSMKSLPGRIFIVIIYGALSVTQLQ